MVRPLWKLAINSGACGKDNASSSSESLDPEHITAAAFLHPWIRAAVETEAESYCRSVPECRDAGCNGDREWAALLHDIQVSDASHSYYWEARWGQKASCRDARIHPSTEKMEK
ncbi:hypothetical protein NDU88_001869 [Pleurodeles waltl]|uniref:Uncharacterized protein n=1 Tax=Pleurodeles waltl TaxID=8319 RepID=A0AAV7NGD4_PLEWA|nr:hypothetical protein NDU88_001869 [Pleurodeles waltl]